MTAGILPAGGLCLLSGAMLGGLFLAFKLLRLLMGGGRLCIALFDVLFGLLCAVTAFLCALAVDKGRLRLFQVLFQGLGAWGVIASLDPLVNGAVSWIRRAGRWARSFLHRRVWRPIRRGGHWLARLMKKAMRRLLPKRNPRPAKRRPKKRRGSARRGKKQAGRNKQISSGNMRSLHQNKAVTNQSRK